MIYCVVPEALADELYPRLADYYEDDPNVEVIIDRRRSERRMTDDRRTEERAAEMDGGADAELAAGRRELRDRRRPRVAGDFPRVDPE